jgi:hypothetical protein
MNSGIQIAIAANGVVVADISPMQMDGLVVVCFHTGQAAAAGIHTRVSRDTRRIGCSATGDNLIFWLKLIFGVYIIYRILK